MTTIFVRDGYRLPHNRDSDYDSQNDYDESSEDDRE
jgi:hypothetical protein